MARSGTAFTGLLMIVIPVGLVLAGWRERGPLEAAALPVVVFAATYVMFHLARLVLRRGGADETISTGIPGLGAFVLFFVGCAVGVVLEALLHPPLWAFAITPAALGAVLLGWTATTQRTARVFWRLARQVAESDGERTAVDALMKHITGPNTRDSDENMHAQICLDATMVLVRYGYAAEAVTALSSVDTDQLNLVIRPIVGIYLARAQLHRGDITGARQALRDLPGDPIRDSHRRLFLLVRARLAAAKRNAGSALQDIGKAGEIEVGSADDDLDGTISMSEVVTFEARAEARIAQGKPDEARAVLERMHGSFRGHLESLAASKSIAAELASEVVAAHAGDEVAD